MNARPVILQAAAFRLASTDIRCHYPDAYIALPDVHRLWLAPETK